MILERLAESTTTTSLHPSATDNVLVFCIRGERRSSTNVVKKALVFLNFGRLAWARVGSRAYRDLEGETEGRDEFVAAIRRLN